MKSVDCNIAVREFDPQSRYYTHFRVNTPRYDEPSYLHAISKISPLLFFYKDGFSIK